MEIYIVQKGDTFTSIARKYGISTEKLILDNGLSSISNLVEGQALVITYPKQTHTVQPNETLDTIADLYQVTKMQLLRNNPFLTTRELIANETIIVRYDTTGSIATNGFCYPYLGKNTLIRTLPNLTYLSVFNYTITSEGNIITFEEDSSLIETAKEYNVIPLMLLTTLTPFGEQNIELDYQLLLSEKLQDQIIERFRQIIKEKGYLGVNIIFYNLNEENTELYVNFVKKISEKIKEENLYFFITINYDVSVEETQTTVVKIDYSQFTEYISGFIFMRFVWGTNYGPPEPVSNINYVKALIDFVSLSVPNDKISIGKPVIGYDWRLPYVPYLSKANSLSINSVLGLAYETNSVIQFDDISQTPFFYFYELDQNVRQQHIVWFIDARSLLALMQVIKENHLYGNGVWNIMIYNAQVWTIINSLFDIIKLI
ncbi:LysM peptidoglycan-binding domain-containing protein [Candidatus Galacturonibacter soehngenii]|uniref:LysM peptidoglycan-binding domain-containing protein n=1 Tax=Candidatus Galacturonatibacter soehngenii TaxID=2307010 RepID=A0A7V7UBP1_9FIRM|nr:LysM peptidoglycan-binding domain-containing protein [Candidatus Galacturonibacter soehngenii]KAB1437970.1 LysM peptidoglycan-binding domain-containing protein [Candidatus Galacturonibacter soehngenii]MBA4688982.1 LysM peptidoglycan-binding domain-containing protein [Candidatus Galacturonibacter soehngenii]